MSERGPAARSSLEVATQIDAARRSERRAWRFGDRAWFVGVEVIVLSDELVDGLVVVGYRGGHVYEVHPDNLDSAPPRPPQDAKEGT